MPEPRLVVFKIGGSLLDWPEFPSRLSRLLEDYAADRRLLVIGGGGAADVIRALDRIHGFDEETGHFLAVRSLTLTAHILAALLPGVDVVEDRVGAETSWCLGRLPTLAPYRFLVADEGGPPHGWNSTTDTIAARVAEVHGADELVVLKSVDIPAGTPHEDAAARGWVDPEFPRAARSIPRVTFVNLRSFGS